MENQPLAAILDQVPGKGLGALNQRGSPHAARMLASGPRRMREQLGGTMPRTGLMALALAGHVLIANPSLAQRNLLHRS
jgi:hypothetical protein